MLLPLFLVLSSAPQSLRWNHVGYPPSGRPKTILAASDSSLEGRSWSATGPGGAVISGILGAGVEAGSDQSPWEHHHPVDLSAARTEGNWILSVAGFSPASVTVTPRPWRPLAGLAVHHLGTVRSGLEQVVSWRKPSHRGDSACLAWIPEAGATEGTWENTPSLRRLDVSGGWYDAGDYIKFTLTTAGTTWSLLRAWEENPGMFAATRGQGMADVLDEARHGLRYLLKLFPDDTTFVIQVGDGKDHLQGSRLPENDRLEGKRPALTALSPAHMGLTAAALSLGARVFAGVEGQQALSDTCARLGLRLMRAAEQAPRKEVFYHDETNDFYRDGTWFDNLALGAAETWRATGDTAWKVRAQGWLDSVGVAYWTSWGDWELAVAGRLSDDPKALKLLKGGLTGFARWGKGGGAPWGVPMKQGWAPFDGYVQVAAEAFGAASLDTAYPRLAWDIWDYMAGRNNWGVSFAIDTAQPRSVRNLYSQIHPLSGQLGIGALAEGPGSATEHAALVQWFDIPSPSPEDSFNTASVVFYDNATDFQTMETTIGIQGGFVRMLAAMDRAAEDSARSWLGAAPAQVRSTRLRLAGDRVRWSLPRGVAGSLRLVDARGVSTMLRRGTLEPVGEIGLPRGSAPRWLVLTTPQGQETLAVPPF